MANVVMLIRHAEKPIGEGPPYGVTDDGVVDPDSLTPRGWQRAGALVRWFGGEMGPSDAGLPLPTHLFASEIAPQSSSRRPQQTLQPLAQSLRLPIDTSVPKADIGRLATAILAVDGVALVAWEHHLIPSLAAALTGEPSLAPAVWPDDRFDLAWVFERGADADRFRFREVLQRVLAGDSDQPSAVSAGPRPAPGPG
jgi:broad specificity phosphatase PhoE